MPLAAVLALLLVPAAASIPGAAAVADTVVVDTTRATIVLDDADTRRVWITAYWTPLAPDVAPTAHAARAIHDGGAADDGEVRFNLPDTTVGRYAVALYWPRLIRGHDRLATNTRLHIRHAGGRTDLRVDLRSGGDAWFPLGVYDFPPGGDRYVEVINNSADGVVVVDAVRLVPVE